MTKEELGTLILASERQFYATAKTILYSDHDCADAIQETIVKAFVKLQTLKKDAYAKTWLIRILINECYNILRKENRQELLKDRRKNCLKQTEETTDYSELYDTIHALKEKLQIPVVLYYMEDFSIKEIAQILHISEGAVQKRLARARREMKEELQKREAYI